MRLSGEIIKSSWAGGPATVIEEDGPAGLSAILSQWMTTKNIVLLVLVGLIVYKLHQERKR